MITAITEKNSAKYKALFKKATDALKTKAQAASTPQEFKDRYSENFNGIDTLEQYFNCIGDLKSIDLKFTILPVDEDYFEIDANSRMITVPQNTFRKNGIGVVGDQAAEIIYFRIDRYFDSMDLAAQNIEILIQWERADNEKDVSGIWVKDYDTYTDKLVFGWPLDSSVMETPGVLKFSVRFVMYDNNKNIIYSLSTLTTQVTINPGLNFSASELQTDTEVYNMIFNRISNSTISSNDDIEVPAPLFVVSKFSPAFGVEELLILDSEDYVINDNTSINLYAQAYTTSTHGNLTYGLVGTKNSAIDTANYSINNEFLEKVADNTDYNPNMIYYNESGEIKEVNTENDLNDNKFKENNEFYEKVCKATIKKAGTYYFTATNTYNAKNNMTIAEKGYYIPGPSQVEIVPTEKKSYIIYSDSNKKTFTSENIAVRTLNDKNNRTNLKYIWGEGRINSETQKEEFIDLGNEKSDDISYTPAKEGAYMLKVLAKRNNATIETLSDILHVYNEAIAPEASIDDKDYTVGETIECVVKNSASMKTLTYKWYYKNGDNNIIITQLENPETCIIPQGALGKKIYCDVINYNGFEDNKAVTTIETNYIGAE